MRETSFSTVVSVLLDIVPTKLRSAKDFYGKLLLVKRL